MKKTLKVIPLLLVFALTFVSLAGCAPTVEGPAINGVSLEKYAIVYSEEDLDYSIRAAEYIQAQIKERTGLELPLQEDSAVTAEYEIVVGQTEREISSKLNAETTGSQFALMSAGKQVALEGDYFLIAAAAYYFVQTYITGTEFNAKIPQEATICEPIVEDPNNFILLIGDGMGPVHTTLHTAYSAALSADNGYSDGEKLFYGYLFPYSGYSRTKSLTGTTDSAAGGTALSTGYKTNNKYVGMDKDGQPLKSLTELANELGKATAVMSTEPSSGATPASFSAHCITRSEYAEILDSQEEIKKAGTIINCDFNYYSGEEVQTILLPAIEDTLAKLDADEDGFFLMYEEAHIDKHSHNNDVTNTFAAMVRFNQAIGVFMEYALYNPDTFVLITADHETGGLTPQFDFTSDNHTSTDVPVFAFGKGAEVFHNITVENTQIPKTFAKMMGVADFGDLFQPAAL